MKPLCLLMLLCAAALVHGCRYPDPAVIEQQDIRPSIGISGAPEGAQLYVDGLHMGSTASFDGEAGLLLVESGKHIIEIKTADGTVLQSEEVFLGSSTTKIIIFRP